MLKPLHYGILFIILFSSTITVAQELNARIKVMDNQLPNTVDRKIFRTLESSVANFLNKRRWTADVFKPQERIECQFLITLSKVVEQNTYSGIITIQAARPVYKAGYTSPIINYQDQNFEFKYVEGQPLEFNENRVSGNDPMVSNLTAVLAYYAYIILGYDYDSFSLRGGDPYFQKAYNIVSNAPDGRGISGWKSFENANRNRYWLAENLINNRYALIHDFYYAYYRKGMDGLIDDEENARKEILQSLILLENLSRETPNLMVIQFFLLGKSSELIGVFKKMTPQDRTRAVDILSKIDVSNANKYKQELK
ncbi:MAG: DUF4835 family protein [Bacteroidota bacterium]|jgi:hypothetical protein